MLDISQTRLRQVVQGEGHWFSYTYDLGDYCQHEVLVENILLAEKGNQYPVCIDETRDCPPEDCGGVRGYASFLKAIRDPAHEEHQQMLDWVGGEFDPVTFDTVEVNELLPGPGMGSAAEPCCGPRPPSGDNNHSSGSELPCQPIPRSSLLSARVTSGQGSASTHLKVRKSSHPGSISYY